MRQDYSRPTITKMIDINNRNYEMKVQTVMVINSTNIKKAQFAKGAA